MYFEGCPNHGPALQRVRELLKGEGLFAEILEIQISDPASAHEIGFLGSPSVRVNGLDVEPTARTVHEYGKRCHTYVSDAGREGLPFREVIRRALREAESQILSQTP